MMIRAISSKIKLNPWKGCRSF